MYQTGEYREMSETDDCGETSKEGRRWVLQKKHAVDRWTGGRHLVLI